MNLDFTYNIFLAVLILPLALLFFTWLSKGQPVSLPFDNSHSKHGRLLNFFVLLAASLPALILAIAIFLISNPTRNGIPKDIRQMKNVLFCLDVSGSMSAPLGSNKDRYAAAMEAMTNFTNHRQGDSFGLTIFGGEFWHWIPVTKDTGTFKYAEDFLHPRKLPPWMAGSTKIAKALRGCQKELLKKKSGDRMIILISDGASQDLYGSAPSELGAELKKDNICVYAIHIGSATPPSSLSVLTAITGGEVFTATTNQSLNKVFNTIDSMEKARFKQSAPLPVDHFRPFAIAGLALLGIYLLTLFGLRFTPW